MDLGYCTGLSSHGSKSNLAKAKSRHLCPYLASFKNILVNFRKR